VVHDLNGDASALIYLNGTGTLNATDAVDGMLMVLIISRYCATPTALHLLVAQHP